MASGLGAGLLALAKGRQGYNQGKDLQSQRESQVKRQQDQERMLVLKMALEERERMQAEKHRQAVLGETSRHNLAVESAPRVSSTRIDPLSPEGIQATIERDRARAGIPLRARPSSGGGRSSSESVETVLPDGTVVQGKPPRTSEGERKGAGFLALAEAELPKLEEMDANLINSSVRKIPILGNTILKATDPSYQAQAMAGRRWVTQLLRAQSGATITPAEEKSYFEQFIPQPGDTDQTIQDKAAARRKAVETLRTMAGNAIPRGVAPNVNNDAPSAFALESARLNAQYEAAVERGVDPVAAMKVLERELDKLRRRK